MTSLQPLGGPGPSPFDAIRQTRPDGTEFWSARDLMPLLGYSKWERFEDVIERARTAAANTGQDPDLHASRLREASGRTERTDYHLTRYGAYLVAMNGDSRKAEIAAAQSYFAVKTREAEIRVDLPDMTALAAADPNAALAIGRALAGLAQQNLELTAKVAEVAPKAAAYDELVASDGLFDMTSLADTIGMTVRALTAWLVEQGIFRRQVSAQNFRHLPRSKYQPEFFVVKTESNGYVNYPVAYATGAGLDLVMRLRRGGAA